MVKHRGKGRNDRNGLVDQLALRSRGALILAETALAECTVNFLHRPSLPLPTSFAISWLCCGCSHEFSWNGSLGPARVGGFHFVEDGIDPTWRSLFH